MADPDKVSASVGFPPIARRDARVLILGSLPGQASLEARQYYVHPQNAFWKIMHALTGAEGRYEERCESLREAGIAVWDVLARSVRPGSMDADIRTAGAVANDFDAFFRLHDGIRLVCFNGRKAEQMFGKLVKTQELAIRVRFETLPSTSPAYASLAFADKLAIWRSTINSQNKKG